MLAAMSYRHVYAGACHCRNLELRLESDRTPLELGLRTDTCSFCAKHHSMYTSDPAGAVHLAVRDEARLERYRFGTRTADFLLCRTCGVFVAAYATYEDGPQVAVVNVHVLDARAEFLANQLQVADLEGEPVEQRLARRRARWTPVRSFAIGEPAAR
jgi:hypothetical protein